MNTNDRAIERLIRENRSLRENLAAVTAERDFMATRLRMQYPRHEPRVTGMSSDSLVRFALSGDETDLYAPADPSDLMACARTFQMAPAHLKDRMRRTLDQWTASICTKWPQSEVELMDALADLECHAG